MNLLKTTLLAALMATTGGALAETGTLELKGLITGTSCSVPASQMTRGIDIGTLETSTLAAASAGESVFSRDLNFTVTGCPAATTQVRMRFSYINDGTEGAGYIKNNGDAQGALLGLTDSSGTRLNNQDRITATDLDVSAGTASISSVLHAYRTSAAPVSGNIDSNVNVYLEAY